MGWVLAVLLGRPTHMRLPQACVVTANVHVNKGHSLFVQLNTLARNESTVGHACSMRRAVRACSMRRAVHACMILQHVHHLTGRVIATICMCDEPALQFLLCTLLAQAKGPSKVLQHLVQMQAIGVQGLRMQVRIR